MNKFIKPAITIGMMILVFTAVYYAKQNRFDVVACLLLLILYFPQLIEQLINMYFTYHPQHYNDYYPVPPPVIVGKPTSFKNDVEHDMEFYDEGYMVGLLDFLEVKFLDFRSIAELQIFEENHLNKVNQLEKVKQLGKFVIESNSPSHHGPKIIFVKRYPDER